MKIELQMTDSIYNVFCSNVSLKTSGKIIKTYHYSSDEYQKSILVLNKHRQNAFYSLQLLSDTLSKANNNAIITTRLKSLDSIVSKLKRYPSLNLNNIQDICGCRMILPSISHLHTAIDKTKSALINHILVKESDYISQPKESGYRGYNMIYKIDGTNILTEIQIMSHLQHIYTMTVELMEFYTGYNIKDGLCDKRISRFFTLVSSLFAITEECSVYPNTSDSIDKLVQEIVQIDSEIKILNKLKAMPLVCKILDIPQNTNDNSYKYYILQISNCDFKLNIYPFSCNQYQETLNLYENIENANTVYGNQNVVLVSAKSLHSLRMGYPNYFGDTDKFITTLKLIIEENTSYRLTI